jgi:small subunit ribosomal protein S12
MVTLNQLFMEKRKKRKKKNRTAALNNCPQLKAICIKIFVMSPRKPNSAKRKVARVLLTTHKKITCYIPGIGNNLQKHSAVLVRGKGPKDLPSINYRLIRGKYDLKKVIGRSISRSKHAKN